MTDQGPRKRAVLVVDDHPLMRDGLSQLIDQQPDLRVCGGANSGPEALEALDRLEPDLMLVDISLPGMDGIELIKAVRKRTVRLPLLVLSMHDESLYAERAVRAGAKGYVMKHASAETLLAAIRRVLDGKVYLSPAMTEKLPEPVKAAFLAGIPMQRFGLPADVARAVRFLCSDDAAYITGQVLHVNGGLYT